MEWQGRIREIKLSLNQLEVAQTGICQEIERRIDRIQETVRKMGKSTDDQIERMENRLKTIVG